MCYVYELLNDRFKVSAYYYNPNIMPVSEYDARYNELVRFSNSKHFQLHVTEPDRREWIRRISPFRYQGEKSARCHECFRIRLEQTFLKAEHDKYDIVATSLSISPHKDAEAINSIGAKLSSEYGITFYEADFKKKDGFKKSVDMSRSYGFYRQDYCGCIYSMLEKNPDSTRSQMVRNNRKNATAIPDNNSTVKLELGTELDLHHFNPADTENIVTEFLRIAVEKGYPNIRIIHGKGKSRIKMRVHAVLDNSPAVCDYHDDSFNWGTTIVELTPFTLC